MRSRATLLLFVALASLAAASVPLQACAAARRPMPSWDGRVVLRLHGGASFPMGNFGSTYQTGFGGGGSIGYGVSENVLISWGVAYHHFDHETFTNLDANITPYTIGVDYKIPVRSGIRPWVGGGIGLYHVAESVDLGGGATATVSENNFGLHFGGGIGAPIGAKTMIGTGLKFHYVGGDNFIDTPFITYQVGVAAIL
jgi:Outer membrane protein beta-barrel domain